MSGMDDAEAHLVWISASGVNQLARGREMTRAEAMESITNHGWALHQFVDTPPGGSLLGHAAVLSYIPLASTDGKAVTYVGLPADAARSVLAGRRRILKADPSKALPPPLISLRRPAPPPRR